MIYRPGRDGAMKTNETIMVAKALGGVCQTRYLTNAEGNVGEFTLEVVLTAEQAAVISGRLDKLRQDEDEGKS